MGLDITAYSRLEHVGKHTKDPTENEGEPGGMDDWCYYDGHVQAYAYDDFPQSFRGIPILGKRAVGQSTFLEGGCYEATARTHTHSFRAGSYTGYGLWRADLQSRFNPNCDPDGPFYELIFFADNEGSIGPEASKDLLADFLLYFERYPADEWDLAKYKDWLNAFKLAADGGLVHFH